MELRWLASFVVVAEELHFARAADRLHLAPSALSAQIKALESHLGVRLIDRGRRSRPALTGAGRLFLVEAQRTLEQARRAQAVGRQAGRGQLGHVEIAYVASAAFSGALTTILRGCPGLTVGVREAETPAQLAALASGDVDIGFLRWRPEYPPGITTTCLLTEEVVVALPSGSKPASYEAVPAEVLRDERLVVPHFQEEHGFLELIHQVAERGGFQPHVAPPVRDFVAALTLVGAGLGVTLVPESLRRVQLQGVTYRPLADLVLTTRLVGAYRRGEASPAVRTVVARLRELAAGRRPKAPWPVGA